MKAISMALLFLLISTAFLCGCLSKPESAEADSVVQMHQMYPEKNLTGIELTALANNRFALNLYRELAGEGNNVFFSPWSLNSALAMTYEGARGNTSDEMRSVLYFSENDSFRRESFSTLDRRINANDSGYTLSTANALWVDSGLSLLDDYEALVKDTYQAQADNLDFRAAPEKARQTINHWVEQKTAGKIVDLIPAGHVDSLTRLVLTNAIYFNGTWMRTFDPSLTVDEDFLTEDGRAVKVPMMRQDDDETWFNYLEIGGLQVLEMPYAGGRLSVMILLPHDQDIASLERSLSSEDLDRWRDSLEERRVDVYLPRFKLKANYFLAEILADLGMPTAFSNMADFTGISPDRPLFISQVIHQAYVDVNEQGTEAAAATAVEMAEAAAGAEEPEIPVFRADHPFLFLIVDDETGCILFLGRVSDPNLE